MGVFNCVTVDGRLLRITSKKDKVTAQHSEKKG